MNFFSVPYENDYGMYADSKIKNSPQYPQMNMNPGMGQGQAMQQLNPPQMNLQMQMPSGIPPMSSYPMQSMPLNMMPGGGNGGMTPMSAMSTQLPIGAMTPLSSMTMMPMGNAMGSIDAPGINAVLPDLQPMSTMGQMQPMQQYDHSPSNTQMQQGRLTGGGPSHAGGWSSNPNQSNSNSGMWSYSQPMQHQQHHQPQQHMQQMQYNQHQHHQHQQHQQQQHNQAHQQQQQQQGNRMKSIYDLQPAGMNYRELRNGLNTPTTNEPTKFSKVNNSFNCGKTSSKVPHWR